MNKNQQFWEAMREYILLQRGPMCEICMSRRWTELNHCLFNRMKDHPELDCVENMQAVCKICHEREGHTKKNRLLFWHKQCYRYGVEHMKNWLRKINAGFKAKKYYGEGE